jgi:hypothetical protein
VQQRFGRQFESKQGSPTVQQHGGEQGRWIAGEQQQQGRFEPATGAHGMLAPRRARAGTDGRGHCCVCPTDGPGGPGCSCAQHNLPARPCGARRCLGNTGFGEAVAHSVAPVDDAFARLRLLSLLVAHPFRRRGDDLVAAAGDGAAAVHVARPTRGDHGDWQQFGGVVHGFLGSGGGWGRHEPKAATAVGLSGTQIHRQRERSRYRGALCWCVQHEDARHEACRERVCDPP